MKAAGRPRAAWSAKNCNSPGLVGGVQPFEKQATEERERTRNGEKEAGPAGDPALAIGRDAAARDDDMGMRMVAPTPTIP